MATTRERQREVQLYRGYIPSPGRPGIDGVQSDNRHPGVLRRPAKSLAARQPTRMRTDCYVTSRRVLTWRAGTLKTSMRSQ